MKEWFARFRRDFGFWSLHCLVSALPGFCTAMWLVGLSKHFSAFMAMLAALFTMILAINAVMSIWPSLTGWRTLPSRGLRVGLVLRAMCSGASLVIIVLVLLAHGRNGGSILIVLPDLWAGLGAVLAIGLLSVPLGYDNPATYILDGGKDLGFAVIYLIALIDGLILCFLIFIWSFVSMLVLQIRDRRRLYSGYGRSMIPADDGSGVRGNPG